MGTIAKTAAEWTGQAYTPDSFPKDIDYELREAAANNLNKLRVYDTPGGTAAGATIARMSTHFVNTSRSLMKLREEYGFSYEDWFALQWKTNPSTALPVTVPTSSEVLYHRDRAEPHMMSLTTLSTDQQGNVTYTGPILFNDTLPTVAARAQSAGNPTWFHALKRGYNMASSELVRRWNTLTPSDRYMLKVQGTASSEAEYCARLAGPQLFNPSRITAPNDAAFHVGDIYVIRKSLKVAVWTPYTALGTDFPSFLASALAIARDPDVVMLGVHVSAMSPGYYLYWLPVGVRVEPGDFDSMMRTGPIPLLPKYGARWAACLQSYERIVDHFESAHRLRLGGTQLPQIYRVAYQDSKRLLSAVQGEVQEWVSVASLPSPPHAQQEDTPSMLGLHAYSEQTSSPPAGDPLAGDPHAPALPLPGDPTLPPLAGVPQAGLPVGGEAPAGIPMAALAVLGLAAIALIMSQRRKS